MAHTPHRVMVVGGGFGGVRAAVQLSHHPEVEVTLLSKHSTFAYYPQFYHSATGGSRSEVALPLNAIFSGRPVKLIKDELYSLDPAARSLTTTSGATHTYDSVVLALGSVTNYFGIKGLQDYSFDIKTIDGAEKLKRHMHRQMLDTDAASRRFVVVGGGPTGVELAASIGEYLTMIAAKHQLKAPDFSVELIEGSPRILPRMTDAFSARVKLQLQELGVKVTEGAVVKGETERRLMLDGRTITSDTVVWTAGASNSPFYAGQAEVFSFAKNRKVVVNEYLQSHPGVYVIGDNADTKYSGYAQTAIHNANFVAKDVLRTIHNDARSAYKPARPFDVLPVGPKWAAARVGEFTFYGYPAYLLRELADLIGYADVERWPAAVHVWLIDRKNANGCRMCDSTVAKE